ncbi:DegT/DnrJ/EryC1/StrS family aminotransferase [Membranihabitans maritimus]|uniref:DegT/DnrJ/EryC1/StrS family aminotransferase n=1 Tax=Membranihabitans maritimus TaxID=2904244 RepID=UPI001F2AFB36|nr:DegT/DnrJ/EryC1/StrS family aminotransferase [Membranihabitans maritimus]
MKNLQMVDLKGQYLPIQDEIDTLIRDCIDSTQFINGPQVRSFENHLSEFLGVKHVIGCANGTDALQIAIMAANLPKGSEIIVPDFTFIATAEVVSLLGYIPVFADVDYNHFNISPKSIESAVSAKTSAILPVHLFGQSCNMELIVKIAEKYNLKIIEDNAQAIGASFLWANGDKQKLGTIGDIGCTSFFPSKNLGAYGDGGAIFTNNDELAHKIRILCNHGMETRYYHDEIGVNSRLDSIQACVLEVKLKYLPSYNQARYDAASLYKQMLKDVDEIVLPEESKYSDHVYHQFTLKITNGQRDQLKTYLDEQGIPSGVYYPVPLHKQKAFAKNPSRTSDCKHSIQLSKEVISLPMHTELNEEMIRFITGKIIDFFQK